MHRELIELVRNDTTGELKRLFQCIDHDVEMNRWEWGCMLYIDEFTIKTWKDRFCSVFGNGHYYGEAVPYWELKLLVLQNKLAYPHYLE